MADPKRAMSRRLVFALLACVLVLATGADALVLHPNSALGSPDPGAPPPAGDDPGWELTGRFGGGSAVYLGFNAEAERWILTARHVGAGAFELGGESYATDGFVGFTNPVGGNADLRAYRLVGGPLFAGVEAIAASTPVPGEALTSIGTGRVEGAFTCWDAAWNVTSCVAPAHRGYPWTSPRTKRWGTNLVTPASVAIDALADDLGLDDEFFVSRFDDAATVLEAQGATGDSGAPVFVPDGAGGFELAGITIAVGAIPADANRPPGLGVLTEDLTFHADLSFYRDQILAQTGVLLPEPGRGTAGLAGAALLAWLARRRRV